MASEHLISTTTELFASCPRFRVLVVGKSGEGKSSLINYAFGVDIKSASVSHQKSGQCDINEEISALENERFVLHDSMGFEYGDAKNFETVKNFLANRNQRELPDRVHAIWLCIQAPHAGGRVFETGDEDLLKLATEMKIPVVVFFTQFDVFVKSIRLPLLTSRPPNLDKVCAEKVASEFERLCLQPLEKLNPNLSHACSAGLSGKPHAKPDYGALAGLVQVTGKLVRKTFEEVWILSAIAQRSSAQEKIEGSIAVGMKQYFRGLASSANFKGHRLDDCIRVVHKDMTDSWNFYDPTDLLHSSKFVEKMMVLAQLLTSNDVQVKSYLNSDNNDAMQTLLGTVVGTTVAATIGPVLAGIGLSVWFVKFLTEVYQKTPETLRCFMGYIIDLTLVLDQLFLVVLPRMPPRRLTQEDLDTAFENYENSELGRVHHEIRQYVREGNFVQLIQEKPAEEKVKELIRKYSSIVN